MKFYYMVVYRVNSYSVPAEWTFHESYEKAKERLEHFKGCNIGTVKFFIQSIVNSAAIN